MERTQKSLNSLKWYRRIAWGPLITLVVLPVCGFVSALWVRLSARTAIFTLAYGFIVVLCVTAGKYGDHKFSIMLGSRKLIETRISSAMVP
jgi:hypothetical protein